MSQPLADVEQTRNRLEILNQFFRGMLLLNGGGCVALLAFLQAIWENAKRGFVQDILEGMAFFIFGLVCTVAGQYIRYETSKAVQFQKWYKRHLQRAYLSLVILSGLAFAIGAAMVVIGTWDFAEYLPTHNPAHEGDGFGSS
jgi:hypothetical protein